MLRTELRHLWTMTASDLRQRIRDKSVIIFALVVPLALMFVFNLALSGMQDVTLGTIDVAVAMPDGDQLAARLVDAASAPRPWRSADHRARRRGPGPGAVRRGGDGHHRPRGLQ